MLHIRKSLLPVLLMVAIMTVVVGSTGLANAAPRLSTSEPISQPITPPPVNPDPNSGEPDSGSTRSQQTTPGIRTTSIGDAQFAIRAVRAVRWTSLVWVQRVIGFGS